MWGGTASELTLEVRFGVVLRPFFLLLFVVVTTMMMRGGVLSPPVRHRSTRVSYSSIGSSFECWTRVVHRSSFHTSFLGHTHTSVTHTRQSHTHTRQSQVEITREARTPTPTERQRLVESLASVTQKTCHGVSHVRCAPLTHASLFFFVVVRQNQVVVRRVIETHTHAPLAAVCREKGGDRSSIDAVVGAHRFARAPRTTMPGVPCVSCLVRGLVGSGVGRSFRFDR